MLTCKEDHIQWRGQDWHPEYTQNGIPNANGQGDRFSISSEKGCTPFPLGTCLDPTLGDWEAGLSAAGEAQDFSGDLGSASGWLQPGHMTGFKAENLQDLLCLRATAIWLGSSLASLWSRCHSVPEEQKLSHPKCLVYLWYFPYGVCKLRFKICVCVLYHLYIRHFLSWPLWD